MTIRYLELNATCAGKLQNVELTLPNNLLMNVSRKFVYFHIVLKRLIHG